MRDDELVDPLDALATAWRGLAPPDPTASVEMPDAATRAAVDWMRAAWHALAPPPIATLPWRLRLRIVRPRVSTLLPQLAAAAAVVVAALFWIDERSREGHATKHDAREVAASPRPLVPTSIDADQMELRSGPVRLILLTSSGKESNR